MRGVKIGTTDRLREGQHDVRHEFVDRVVRLGLADYHERWVGRQVPFRQLNPESALRVVRRKKPCLALVDTTPDPTASPDGTSAAR